MFHETSNSHWPSSCTNSAVDAAKQGRDRRVRRTGFFIRHPIVEGEIEPPEFVLGHEVGDACDRVGTENRRAAVQQELHPLDRDARHKGVDIDPIPPGPVGYRIADRSLAIQNREGVFVAHASQIDRGVTIRPLTFAGWIGCSLSYSCYKRVVFNGMPQVASIQQEHKSTMALVGTVEPAGSRF